MRQITSDTDRDIGKRFDTFVDSADYDALVLRLSDGDSECARLRAHIKTFIDGQGSRSFKAQVVFLANERKRHENALLAAQECLLDTISLMDSGMKESARDAAKDALERVRNGLTPQPGPSGLSITSPSNEGVGAGRAAAVGDAYAIACREALAAVMKEWVNGRKVADGISLPVRQQADAALAKNPTDAVAQLVGDTQAPPPAGAIEQPRQGTDAGLNPVGVHPSASPLTMEIPK